MDRPLTRLSDRPMYDFRTGSFDFVEVPNYLTQEERTRLRNDKANMYVQRAYMREPVIYVQDIPGTYGKAKIYRAEQGNEIFLRSYDTIVCSVYKVFDDHEWRYYFTRFWDKWSATTNRHVNEFLCTYFNHASTGISKKTWLSYPIYKPVLLNAKED